MAEELSPPLRMKLLVDTHGKMVLFAEASKECIDFLFHILSLPMATVISLLKNQEMLGSLANLYSSVENFDVSYIQPNQNKATLLKPTPPVLVGYSTPVLFLNNAPSQNKFYKCGNSHCYVSEDPTSSCPSCGLKMTEKMPYVANGGGFVKGVVTYMVMDDLVVTPLSSISSITLLNKFNVKDVGALEEMDVNLGMDEAVKLLKASLQSKKVLTEVFLGDMMKDIK